MDLQLAGKKALVCASSKGLGFAIAKSLAAEGCSVFLCARNESDLKAAAQKLEDFPGKIAYKAADLTDANDIASLAADVKEKFGGIDILINNVGGPAPTAAAETTPQQWQKGFEQIFLSNHLVSAEFLPHMREQKFGRIINITSLSVLEPIENLAVSTAMRSAVTANAKTLANEMAPHGITVNTVMPGIIHTGRVEYLREKKAERLGTTKEIEMQKTKDAIPSKRLGRPEELADLVTFLASPKAGYITGTNISVDGGHRKSW